MVNIWPLPHIYSFVDSVWFVIRKTIMCISCQNCSLKIRPNVWRLNISYNFIIFPCIWLVTPKVNFWALANFDNTIQVSLYVPIDFFGNMHGPMSNRTLRKSKGENISIKVLTWGTSGPKFPWKNEMIVKERMFFHFEAISLTSNH